MGGVTQLMKAFSCEAMWKYCCNAQHLKSRCCHDFCEIEYETDLVPIESESDTEIHVDGCCSARTSK